MGLKRKRIKRVALALPLDVNFPERLIPGILEFARNQGGWEFTRVPEGMSPSFDWLRGWTGDGAFVILGNKRDVQVARSLPIPIVNVGGYIFDRNIPTVTLDHQLIGRLGAEHLLARRFRRFGFYGTRELWNSQQREIGFRAAIEGAGYKVSSLESSSLIGSPYEGRQAAGELAKWLRSLVLPVGIMATRDVRAQMLSEACAMIGLRVPEDVAIVGVDNDPVICEFCVPPLSSVALRHKDLGWRAAELLSDLLSKGQPPKCPILVPPESVVARRSTDSLGIEDPEIANIVQQIRDHIDEVFGAERLLKLTTLSRRQLEHRFRKSVGSSPYRFINELRVERAKELLTSPKKSTLTQLASECGFSELRRFRLVFRRIARTSPADYRQNWLAQNSDNSRLNSLDM